MPSCVLVVWQLVKLVKWVGESIHGHGRKLEFEFCALCQTMTAGSVRSSPAMLKLNLLMICDQFSPSLNVIACTIYSLTFFSCDWICMMYQYVEIDDIFCMWMTQGSWAVSEMVPGSAGLVITAQRSQNYAQACFWLSSSWIHVILEYEIIWIKLCWSIDLKFLSIPWWCLIVLDNLYV